MRAAGTDERTRSIDAGGEDRSGGRPGPPPASTSARPRGANARDWTVCGKPSVPGRSYCQEHVEICYQGGGRKEGRMGKKLNKGEEKIASNNI